MTAAEASLEMDLVHPRADEVITLRDGRRLAYAEWGEPAGKPVLFFHGTPGSRLLFPGVLAPSAGGLRLITVDRPGYGGSDPRPSRTVLAWADDVAELADALELDRFAVAGWSGGGPHALACAARLAGRVERAVVVAAPADRHVIPGGLDEIGEDDRRLVELGEDDPLAYRAEMEARGAWLRERRDRPETFLAVERPPADQRVALRPEVAQAAMVWLPEAARRGLDGYAEDWLAVRLPWRFDPAEVAVEVDVWHGALDADVPPAHGEFLAARLPRAGLTVWREEGHWGIFPRWSEVAASLAVA